MSICKPLTQELLLKTLRNSLASFFFLFLVAPPILLAQEVENEEAEETTEATELEEAPVVPAQEIEEIVVTGSRLQRTPGELAANLITLDEDFIDSTGEVTLERVLRQLPQNSNPTSERFGSDLNSATNFTGASTVNLRGFGSESTLVLVDGKRIGHTGVLGGVSDVSQIPLSMVERIEILLDGASAIYGSDAVGGVVNIITRKDYEGVELNLNYNWPSEDGFDELQGSISGGFSLGQNTRVRASAQRTDHSGMDASDREVVLFDQTIFPGPQFHAQLEVQDPNDSSQTINLPVLYTLDGMVLTFGEYLMLSPEDQARAVPQNHAVLPLGFNETSSLNEITQFDAPNWGPETQAGIGVLPESVSDSFTLNLEHDFGDYLTAELRVRYQNRETVQGRGYVSFSGELFGFRNPFNPLARNVQLRGQRRDLPPQRYETESETLDIGVDLEGAFGDSGWEWEASFGQVTSESDTLFSNAFNRAAVRGGLAFSTQFLQGISEEECLSRGGDYTPERIFFGFLIPSRCSVPPPPAVNPFGDLSEFIDTLTASNSNEQTRLEALVRGDLFELPGGDVRVLVGYAWEELVLDTATEFQAGLTFDSPTGQVSSLDTDAERSNQAAFFESSVPIIGAGNSRPGIESLSLSLSGRWDSYDEPSVIFNQAEGGPMAAENLTDPGAEFTWGTGIVYTPIPDLRIKVNRNTAFVAPQLNQVIVATGITPDAGIRNIFVEQGDGSIRQVQTQVIEGGNGDLKAETADTLSYGFEFNPRFVPDLGFRATWNETEYKDRINRLANFIVDPTNLPSDTRCIEVAEGGGCNLFEQERRWINVSSVEREGTDYELFYFRPTEMGEFGVQVRHSRTTNFEYLVDPSSGDAPVNVLSHTQGRTTVGVVPRSSTNAQLSWEHRGLKVSLDYLTIDETARTSTAGGTSITNVYTPPELLDLTIRYQFGPGGLLPTPGMLDGAQIIFTVNNLTDDFGETSIYNQDGMQLQQSSSDPSPLYGRVFNLSYRMSIGGI